MHISSLVAEVLEKGRKPVQAQALVEEAFQLVAKTGEGWCEAELYRLRGQLLDGLQPHGPGLKSEPSLDAEKYLRQSIDIARRQSAKSLELRAVTSLSRLFQKQGKKEEARRILAEIYDWFTEGFDTADLKDAKALLEELS